MNKMKIIAQKIKGQAQQVKGDIEIAAGEPIHGNVDKVRGKANEFAADVKMKIENTKTSK